MAWFLKFVPDTCFFYKQLFFSNSTSVLLNVFMNWASNVAYVLLNTCKHHHTETFFIFTIFLSISRPGLLFMSYLYDPFFIFIFIFITVNHMISWLQTHLIFCSFFRICPIIFGWQREWRVWIFFKYLTFSLRVLLSICLIFYQFQHGFAFKKSVYFTHDLVLIKDDSYYKNRMNVSVINQ